MKLTTKALKLLDATPGVHIHKGRLRIALKIPSKSAPVRKSLGLLPTEANIIYAGNKLSSMKIDVQTGNFSADEDTFWHKHFPSDPRHNIATYTLRDYFELYRVSRQYDLAYGNELGMRSVISMLEQHNVLDKDLRDLTHRDLEQVRNQALITRKVSTVKLYFTRLKAVVNEAIKDGYINESPFSRLRNLRNVNEGGDPSEVVMPFSQSELQRLLAACRYERHRQMISFLFWTGIRPGELKALAWEDVDLELGTARIRYSLSRSGYIKPPKTHSGIRTIDLLPPAIDVLKRQRELTFMLPAQDDEVRLLHNKKRIEQRRRVFMYGDSKLHKKPALFTGHRSWIALMRRANLTYREPYQLRHSYASMMLMIGAHPAYLAKQMGHKDWGMIRTIYAKWIADENPDYRDELAKKLKNLDPHATPEGNPKHQASDK